MTETTEQTEQRPPAPKPKPSWLFKLVYALLITLSMLVIAGSASVFYLLRDLPKFDATTLGSLAATSQVYDRNGAVVTTLHGHQNRLPIPLEQVPETMKNAILAAEDLRFYDHQGIDVRAIFRALVTNLQDGRYSQGASTITQQLIKNAFLTNEKTLRRKAHEAMLSIRVESMFTKDQILEMYLNRIYFGNGAYGIQAASQLYFGKDAKDLNAAESALLAAIPRRPSYYTPNNNPENARERRNTILSVMAKNNMISEFQYEKAKREPLPEQLHTSAADKTYAAYIDYVIDELVHRHNFPEDQVYQGGLKIYTAMDPLIQQTTEQTLADTNHFPPGPEDQLIQAAVAVVDHRSGEIRGLGGGRSYEGNRSFNRASQLRRQPGSVIKPILVYAPAMEQGFSPDDTITDMPMDYSGYAPVNYDGQFRGPVTLRQAVAYSINLPAVYLYKLIGPANGVKFANSVGLNLNPNEVYLSLALGGLSNGVSPLQMAGAYAAIANRGNYIEPRAVTKVVDAAGKTYSFDSTPQQVLSPAAAYRMTEMLTATVEWGTGSRARLGRPVAGKTGTTELPPVAEFQNVTKKGNKDAWFVGYTPELTCAVWMGYDRTDARHYLNQIYGGSYPAEIFQAILSTALKDAPVQSFDPPENYTSPRPSRFLGPGSWSPKPKSTPSSPPATTLPMPAPGSQPATPLPPSSPPGETPSVTILAPTPVVPVETPPTTPSTPTPPATSAAPSSSSSPSPSSTPASPEPLTP
ncbi:transglycosylase domain-containing protein [Heliophilum fasciatum]|uniref:Penicillin-binding protein 1A n=1 Tax=Heliophilum fasciatum TaxID=35700 RepID=A0A4R2RJ09_9FIRM|nr:PBP1A family penicillin-binding protein [Heliophilum fasciatum]MCW2278324.1 1A family penicillin-binding protein [Heliophilum fasciatum]TCP63802.1 penicillin-binding protein 2A [Heliophilum fasciatum]